MKNSTTILLVVCGVAVLPVAAHAYLDAGSGSYFIQIVIGAIVGAAVALKVYFGRVKALAGRIFRRKNKDGA